MFCSKVETMISTHPQSSYATGFIPVEIGFCTTPIPISGATSVVRKPVNHRDKPGGERKFACLRTSAFHDCVYACQAIARLFCDQLSLLPLGRGRRWPTGRMRGLFCQAACEKNPLTLTLSPKSFAATRLCDSTCRLANDSGGTGGTGLSFFPSTQS